MSNSSEILDVDGIRQAFVPSPSPSPSPVWQLTQQMWLNTQDDVNTFFLICLGTIVFMLQLAFPLLESGSVRSKNIINIIFQNIMQCCVGSAAWFLTGFAFAYGDGNSFVGLTYFGLQDVNEVGSTGRFALWFYSLTFCLTAGSIPSGCMAERTQVKAFMIFSFINASVTYPIVVHWMWSSQGWLGAFSDDPPISTFGCLDFAGGITVHIIGGIAGLVGILAVGPRLGRFDNDGPKPQGHNIVIVAEGTLLLWFAFYGFNCGSTGIVTNGISQTVSLVAVNTSLSGAFGGLAAFAFSTLLDKKMDLAICCNGIISGLVAITSCAAYIDTWAAVICGSVGGLLFVLVQRLVIRLKWDDPVDGIAVHVVNGSWSAIVNGLFASREHVSYFHRQIQPSPGNDNYGLFMGGGARQLAAQIVGILVVIFWCLANDIIIFIPLRLFKVLRVPIEEERIGLDEAKHGGHAFPEHALIMRTLATKLLNKE